ncbi:MAG: PQQ-like beta-propeller repeat protein [Candidatus Hydrogenedentes bacterium]|nr:PQQ-like beta-propeller repeat protein [Candidatus Hydrogenedentota bacterium]
MNRNWLSIGLGALCGMQLVSWPGAAMELVWTRTTGQFRYESTPLLVDRDGPQEILGVNVGGQVLAWRLDGTDAGTGQDGLVAQLPEGNWTSTPTVVETAAGRRYVFVSVEGLAVALDASWQPAWQHTLPGKTQWARATPLVVDTQMGRCLYVGDLSGAITCLSDTGSVVWSTKPGEGGCATMLQRLDQEDQTLLLAPVGTRLHALRLTGEPVWASDLGGKIISRPEVLVHERKTYLFCGAGAGELFALSETGKVRWHAAIGDEIDSSIAILPRKDAAPLVVCTGLWGNCHAFDLSGMRQWTHQFRAKNRTKPLVTDVNGDGAQDVLVATYAQHAYALDANGHLMDDIRLSGTVNGSPIAVPAAPGTDVVFVSTTLLAHRFRPGPPQARFGVVTATKPTAEAEGLACALSEAGGVLLVENPARRLLRVNAQSHGEKAAPSVCSALSARGLVVLPLPQPVAGSPAVKVTVHAFTGELLHETVLETARPVPPGGTQASLQAWVTLPYAPAPDDLSRPELTAASEAATPLLYQNEAGALALLVQAVTASPLLVQWPPPKTAEGVAFTGTMAARQVVGVETINGEIVEDALRPLGPDRLAFLKAGAVSKLWFSTDAGTAAPGRYTTDVTLTPLEAGIAPVTVPLAFEVLPLELPPSRLTFCTWDYAPNQWFPKDAAKTLDDMGRHGVNVFPRNLVAKAVWRDGALEIDWSLLDEELARLEGRGEILFHVGAPAIEGIETVAEAERHGLHLEYLRRFRDHLRERGLDYDDWALYPVDEPGLDYGPRVPVFLEAARLFREADPRIRIYTDPVPGLSLKDFEAIDPFVDVWCPNMRMVTGLFFDDPRMTQIMAANKPVWSYECIAQVKSMSPLRYNRGVGRHRTLDAQHNASGPVAGECRQE